MSSSPNASVLGWEPGVIGLAFALMMAGVSLGQTAFYLRAFLDDYRSIKVVVILVFVLDMLHTYFASAIYWRLLVVCHRNTTPKCQVIPWEMIAAMMSSATITFVVQCFYAHRVWIISSKSRKLTGSVLVTAMGQYGLGILLTVTAVQTRNATAVFTSLLEIPYAVAGAMCEVLISGVILFYLRSGRTRARRSNNYIQQLVIISVQMGVFTALVAIAWLLLYFVRGGRYWTALPSSILCKSNANSMFAVLNARKSIRSRQNNPISLIPLTTINLSSRSE